MPITPRQLDVLDFIVQFIRDNRYAPTLQEIADRFDLSRVTVLQHLEALEEKGYLERQPNQARGITVKKTVETPSSKSDQKRGRIRDSRSGEAYNLEEEREHDRVQYALPMSGYLADEQRVEQLNTPRFIPVDELAFRSDDCYLIEVRCDLLREDHIIEGDYLIIDEQKSGQPGDLVVVQSESNEPYIGRMGSDDRPEPISPQDNEEHDEHRTPEEDRVAGTVSGIFRTFD